MIVVILGGGDLASGVALRLHRAGLRVAITELAQPLVVRRKVSFAEAVYTGETTVEEVTARRVNDPTDMLRILQVFAKGQLPVLVDPDAAAVKLLHPSVLIDARMLKREVALFPIPINLIIGLGPGFTAGENCHAVVETNRGHMLGRVIWKGSGEPDTGVPEAVGDRRADRVLRAPAEGIFQPGAEICDHVEAGQQIAEVNGQPLVAPFKGVLRGLLHPGLQVHVGDKVGDLDPRDDDRFCRLVSDKSLAVGGGVMEAILSRSEFRSTFWN